MTNNFHKYYVQLLNNYTNMKLNQEKFEVLRKLSKNPGSNQRKLAKEMELSLGKLNYVITELKKKGLVKIENFKKNPKKNGYLYLLTPKGIAEKTELTLKFMKKKLEEYDELKREAKDDSKED